MHFHDRRPVKQPQLDLRWQKERVFVVESKFNLVGSESIRYVLRSVGQRFNPIYMLTTIKHGGGGGIVMVNRTFCLDGTGLLVQIQSIMIDDVYCCMVFNTMLPWARRNIPLEWLLQQNTYESRCEGDIPPPSQSPNLNPIEYFWKALKHRYAAIPRRTKKKTEVCHPRGWIEHPDGHLACTSVLLPPSVDLNANNTKYCTPSHAQSWCMIIKRINKTSLKIN